MADWTPEQRAELCAGLKSLMDLFDRTRAAWLRDFGTTDGHSEWFRQSLNLQMGGGRSA